MGCMLVCMEPKHVAQHKQTLILIDCQVNLDILARDWPLDKAWCELEFTDNTDKKITKEQ